MLGPATMPILNFYAGLALDRMSERRRDAAFIAQLRADPASRLVPVWKAQNLVAEGSEPEAAFVEAAAWTAGETTFLGVAEGIAYFTADVSATAEPDIRRLIDGRGRFVDLRSVGPVMERQQSALLALARGLAHWHARHRHCGACGAPTVAIAAGHVRQCTNPGCAIEHFPRTDPAVIMLVIRGDRCFLARNKRFAAPWYSTLAGFVEPGESLEDAVAREVFEEAGLRVTDAHYRSSQPWPFPASIMLGFWATAMNDDFRLDDDELVDAGWFTRAQLGAASDPDVFRLPRVDSIARRLIEDWIAAG